MVVPMNRVAAASTRVVKIGLLVHKRPQNAGGQFPRHFCCRLALRKKFQIRVLIFIPAVVWQCRTGTLPG